VLYSTFSYSSKILLKIAFPLLGNYLLIYGTTSAISDYRQNMKKDPWIICQIRPSLRITCPLPGTRPADTPHRCGLWATCQCQRLDAGKTGLNKSTLYRLLASLRRWGFVMETDALYSPGSACLQLSLNFDVVLPAIFAWL
jgi:hypothetical protein